MVPSTIRKELARLRRRERLLRLAWGAARWLALAVVVLALMCLTDWLIDRVTDTPWALRVLMLGGQAARWVGAACLLIVIPPERLLRVSRLTLWVDDKTSRLNHRLIATVQLTPQR